MVDGLICPVPFLASMHRAGLKWVEGDQETPYLYGVTHCSSETWVAGGLFALRRRGGRPHCRHQETKTWRAGQRRESGSRRGTESHVRGIAASSNSRLTVGRGSRTKAAR